MSDGLFGQILGGSLGYSSDPRALQNVAMDERARYDLARQVDPMSDEQRRENALAAMNAYGPAVEVPDDPRVPRRRPSLLARLSRWFFQG